MISHVFNLKQMINHKSKFNSMKQFFLIAILGVATFTSCSDDDSNPVPVNEEEVITTVRLTLTPQGTGTPVIFTSTDIDGDGPNVPVATASGELTAFTTYSGTVKVLNEIETPAEDITLEVAEEAEDHQFFYVFSEGSNIEFSYNDTDSDGNPIGIETIFITGEAASGTLNVILRHEANKSADGVSEGLINNAGGATDAEGSFNYTVSN